MDRVLTLLTLILFVFATQSQVHATAVEYAGQRESTAYLHASPQEHEVRFDFEGDQHVQADVDIISTPKQNPLTDPGFLVQCVLAMVGIAGIATAVCTLRKIERQTAATEKQAKHMVDSERPFLIIEVLGDENLASFKVCNHGRSPAKILFMDRTLLPTYLPVGEKLPPIPEYGQQYRNIVDASINAEPVNAEWVSKTGSIFIGSVLPKETIATLRSTLPRENQIGPGAVWHFGVIVYKGLFGDSLYESRYCYRLLAGRWVMLGPYGYNEYT